MKRFACFVLTLFIGLSAMAETPPNTLTPEEKEAGFQLLFDGKELSPDIWQGDLAGYPVKDGVITCRGKNILTKEEFGDFIFRCEVKFPPGGNNGISVRGFEVQLLDHHHPKYKDLKVYQFNGSVYGVVPSKRVPEKNDYLLPVGEWNRYEVTIVGTKIKVILNGEAIVDADLKDYHDKPTLIETLSGGAHPKGIYRLTGNVGFLGHSDPVEFRNIRIKRIDK